MVLGVTPLTLYEDANMKDELVDWTKAENYSGKEYSKFTSSSLSKIFRYLFNEEVGVIVQVPGHFVVVNGFSGTLIVDPDEIPMSGYKATMFNVLDPASSNFKSLKDIIDKWGKIKSLRVLV